MGQIEFAIEEYDPKTVARVFGLRLHPRTGEPLVPVGFTPKGRAVWPILGAAENDDDSSDDDEQDDDGESDEDDDGGKDDEDESDEDDDDGEKPKGKGKDGEKPKGKDDEDDRRSKASRPDPREAELPAWARDQQRELRRENAQRRRQVRELRPKAEMADKYRAALEAGLPARHVKRITGKDYDEMLADAKEIRSDLGLDDEEPKRGRSTRRRRDATGDDSGSGKDDLAGKSADELYRSTSR